MLYCDKCLLKIEDKHYISDNEGKSFHLECFPQEVYDFFIKDLNIDKKMYHCQKCQDTGEVSYWDGVERQYSWCMDCIKGLSRYFKNRLQTISRKSDEIDKYTNDLIGEVNKHIK